MRTLILILATTGLLVIPAKTAGAAPTPPDTRQEVVKSDELKGDIARARGDYISAMDWYSAAIHVEKKNPVLYNKLGIAELKAGRMDAARKSFSQAVRYDSKYVEALNNLGATYCLQRKYRPAVRYLKDALALDEMKASTHLNLAEAWMGQHQIDRAMTEYARALELDADILSSSDKEGIFAQIQTPEQQALVSFLIAKAYAKRGNVEGALDYLRRAKEQNYRNLASVYKEPDFAILWKDPRLTTIVKR